MQDRHAHDVPSPSDELPALGVARPTPVTHGAPIVVLLRREQPLDAGEHEALTDAAARWARRPWSRLSLDPARRFLPSARRGAKSGWARLCDRGL